MLTRYLSHLRIPAIVAAAVLLLAVTTALGAGPKAPVDKDSIRVITLSGGPVDTTVAWEYVPISLNGQTTFSFTQRAGEVLQLVSHAVADPNLYPADPADPSPDSGFCDLAVSVYSPSMEGVGTHVYGSTNRGEFGDGGEDVSGLPAPATDRTITLEAHAVEAGNECDQDVYNEQGELDDTGEDTWTVSLRVSIVLISG